MMLWWKGTSVFFFSPSNEVLDYWAGGSNYMYSGPQLLHCLLFFKLASFELQLVFLTGRGENKNKKNFHICFLLYGSTFFANTNDSVH